MDERERQHLGEELRKAICINNVGRVRELLMNGADVNWRNSFGWTALHWASSGKPDIIKVLLKSSPNINQQANAGYTALHVACLSGSLDSVKLLLATGQCDTEIVIIVGQTALQLAAHRGKQDVVKYLHSVDVNKPAGLVRRVLDHEDDQDLLKYLVSVPSLIRGVLEQAVCEGDVDFINFLVTEQGVDINGPVNKSGNTPIEVAAHEGKLEVIKYLVADQGVDMSELKLVTRVLELSICEGDVSFIKYLVTEQGVDINEPDLVTRVLELTSREGDLGFIKYLVTEKGMDVNGTVNEAGQTPLSLASASGHLDVVKYLVETHQCDPRRTQDKAGQTPLSIAYSNRHLETVKYLVQEQHCDPNFRVNQEDDTPLSLECAHGNLDWVNALISKRADPNEQHLLLACEHQHAAVVKYLLATHHINPNAKDDRQRTPLSLAKNKDVIKLLIQHGADSENVYALHRKVLNNVFSKDPIKNPVKLFVIGHGGEGKSTLIEAMEHEPTFWTSVVNVFVAPREVEGVDQRTAGIIPRVFKSRFFGEVQFFDFAGQESYYSSHAAVIKSAVDTCPPVFILVIGLHRDDATITHSVFYWLGIIFNQCSKMEGKAPLIVVGSHADLVDCLESDHKTQVISQAVEKFSFFDLVSVVSLDCRYSNSSGMKLLRRCVETSCKSLRLQLSVNLNSHMFLIYLVEKYSNELALTLDKVQADLEAAVEQKQSKKHEEVYSFIPTTIERLREICVQLSDKSHILFLPSETPQGVSFVIIDKTALLAEINGTVFAPKDFKQHCELATSTGVVPRSKLAKRFSKFNITMLVRFLSHLELAVPIEDQKVIQLIDKHLDDKKVATTVGEKFLFCPALIRLEAPSQTQVFQSKFSYNFGWLLSSVYSEHFFDARFLHVLILRLALSLGLAPVIDPDIPALQHQCSVWKTGVCWSIRKGAEVLVEVLDRKKVVVLFQSDTVSCDLLRYRTDIVLKVRETARELCSSVTTEELLLSPPDVTYPLNISKTTALFSLKSVAQCLVSNDQFVVSINGIGRLAVSDHEVYANLGENILQPLFNENDPVHTKQISDRFLTAVSSAWIKNPQLIDIVCSVISSEADTTSKTVASLERMKAVLRAWRNDSNGTYKSLRQILDQLSVFAGENPLKLADVQYKEFDENLLPIIEPINCQPYSTDDLVLDDLVRNYKIDKTQLDTMIGEQDLSDLADCFDCVEDYLYKLGLKAGQQTDIKDLAFRCNTKTAMAEALKLWRRPNPLSATYRALLHILLDLKRGDVAVRVCQYITENVPKQKTS